MEGQTKFDEIASKILLSDADLALTFVRVAISRPDANARARGLRSAARAWQQICELICRVQMKRDDLTVLGEKLEEIRAGLADANRPAQKFS